MLRRDDGGEADKTAVLLICRSRHTRLEITDRARRLLF